MLALIALFCAIVQISYILFSALSDSEASEGFVVLLSIVEAVLVMLHFGTR